MPWKSFKFCLYLLLPATIALNPSTRQAATLKDQYHDQLSLIQDYQDQIDKATRALQSYQGGIRDGLSMMSAIQSTRQTANNINSMLDSFGVFDALESAYLYNKSVETYPLMMNALNIGAIKASAAKQQYGSMVTKIVRSYHDQDTAIMYRIHSKMAPEDQARSQENVARVADAYDALLRAAT